MIRHQKLTFLSLIPVVLLCATLVRAEDMVIEQGSTAPSERKELAFPFQGIIAKAPVKDGDRIKVGQVLMVQDQEVEQQRLIGITLEADRSLVIAAKVATLKNREVEFKRKQDLFKRSALSESELLSAELEVVIAAAEVDVAKHDEKVKAAEAKLQELRIKQMSLISTIDGIVEKRLQSEGEVADIDRPSIVIVKNDPMHVELKTLSTTVVQQLKLGQELQVRYPGESWTSGKITFIAPVADARAGRQSIRLEMPNPEGRSTGLTVEVKVPAAPSTALRE